MKNQKPLVNFKLADKDKIAKFVFDLRESLDNSKGFNPRDCIRINLPFGLKKEIISSKDIDFELKEKIKQHIKISEENKKEMKNFSGKLKTTWDKINNSFFNEMEKIIGEKYVQEEYNCYLTDKVIGAYYEDNEITIDYKKDMDVDYACFVLAEEISHLIYWELWKEIYGREIENVDYIFAIKGEKWSCWHIAEIIPEYILTENPEFEKLGWNKRQRYFGYKWIPELKKILDPVWNESKNFREFVKKAHEKVGIKIN